MRFFDVFMLVFGLINLLMIIFTAVCRMNPKLLENEKVEMIYNLIVGNDVYETE